MLKLAGEEIENSIKKKGILPNRRTFLKMLGAGVGIGIVVALGLALLVTLSSGLRLFCLMVPSNRSYGK